MTAAKDPRLDAVIAAMNEPGCPRLYDMLTESFQKASPKERWPGFCHQVGKLELIKLLHEHDGWTLYEARTPSSQATFDILFSKEGRISGLRVKPVATLSVQLKQVRAAYHLPGVAALALRNGTTLETAAIGERKLGEPTPVGVNDVWHLGSDTKAMTATLIAMLVDEHKLQWSDPLPKFFTGWTDVSAGYGAVTLEMLLGHRAGLPDSVLNERFRKMQTAKDQQQARTDYVHDVLRAPPDKAGTYRYANASYMTAGVIVEQLTGSSWETVIRKRLFEPLGLASCGFGPPAHPGMVDQPWAHDCSSGACKPLPPVPKSDNPVALGPAGTVHCSLADWGKFVTMHLRGERGEKTSVSIESMKRLHQPQAGSSYAMGWIIVPTGGVGGTAWSHDGSNRTFYARVWAEPAKGLAFLMATNRGGDEAQKAMNEVTQYFVSRYAQ